MASTGMQGSFIVTNTVWYSVQFKFYFVVKCCIYFPSICRICRTSASVISLISHMSKNIFQIKFEVFMLSVCSPSYSWHEDMKTHFCHNTVALVIWKSHPCTHMHFTAAGGTLMPHIPAYTLVAKLHTLTDVSPHLSKDKVKPCPESHQSPQIRSQKSAHTQTHTDKDKC